MPLISSTGISIDTFNDLFNAISSEYKEIYGQDINIDQDTPDGQKLSIFVKAYRDLQEMGVDIYNSFDPDSAVGTQLNKLIKLAGISRKPATKSTVDINITTTQNVTLPSDYTLSDTSGQLWIISQETTLSTGTTLVSFIADEWGSIEALPNTITEFESIILGVTSATNPSSAIAGIDEESDNDLKIRRKKSVFRASDNTKLGLTAKLLELDTVIDCKVYENNTSATVGSIPAHSLWVIVDGGTVSDIHKVISSDRPSGVDLVGTITDTVTTTITYNDRTLEIDNESKFDRPTEVPIYIRFDVTKKDVDTSIDEEAIKTAIVDNLALYIDDNLYVNELYPYIYQAGTTFIVSSLEISDDNSTWVSDKLETATAEKFTLDIANITITEI